MQLFKYGKKPATYDRRDLRLEHYLGTSNPLPPEPKFFGHENLLKGDVGMLGNDQYGDCVFAGAAHETMLFAREGGNDASFTPKAVLSDYSAVTGFNAHDPNSDQGTDMRVAMSYRKKTGIVDATGKRHKIGAYLAIEPGNIEHLMMAMYLFGAVGIGIQVPNSAQDQFSAGKPWSVVAGSSIEGGHYVPLVARRKNLICVTWGRCQEMTTGFFKKYCDEAFAIVSQEILDNGKTPEGFNLTQLLADLKQL